MSELAKARATMTLATAQAIADFHNAHGGSTWDVLAGNLRGRSLYAVGRHGHAVALKVKERGRYVFVRGTAEDVLEAWEFLGRPEYLGTWWDSEHERAVIERIVLCDTLAQAQARCRREGGRHIFDLETGAMLAAEAP